MNLGNLFNNLAAKFFALTIVLFAISGAINHVQVSSSLNAISLIGNQAEQNLGTYITAKHDEISKNLQQMAGLQLQLAETSNEVERLAKLQDIAEKQAFIRGKFQGVMQIIASQLVSILNPMAAEDREMFVVDEEVYVRVLEQVEGVSFWPVVDAESLEEVAEYEEFEPSHRAVIAKSLELGANTETPHMAIEADQSVIRMVALIGPPATPYGVLDITLKDTISPLMASVEALEKASAANLAGLNAKLKEEISGQQEALKAQIDVSLEERELREAATRRADQSARTSLTIVVVGSAIVGAVAIGLLVIVLITKPIGRNIVIMNELSANNTDVEVTGADRGDEIGQLARNILSFRQSVKDRLEMEKEREDSRLERVRAREQEQRAISSKVETGVEAAISQISDEISKVNGIADELNRSADEALTQTREVASITGEAHALSGTVETEAQQLVSAIEVIENHTTAAGQLARDASGLAVEAHSTVQQLDSAAASVGEVIILINDIAEQTNLLALNATIEAARAGDAGKGFAVVASEVKSLATQTAQATNRIGDQINNIQSVTHQAVDAITSINKKVEEFDGATAGISDAVQRQRVTSHEIAELSEKSSGHTARADELIQKVDGLTRRTDELSDSLKERGNAVSHTISDLGKKLVADVRQVMIKQRQV